MRGVVLWGTSRVNGNDGTTLWLWEWLQNKQDQEDSPDPVLFKRSQIIGKQQSRTMDCRLWVDNDKTANLQDQKVKDQRRQVTISKQQVTSCRQLVFVCLCAGW